MKPGDSTSDDTVESSNENTVEVESNESLHKNLRLALEPLVRELLECPVCSDIMNPPILQCANGHTICQKCQPSIIWCPTCRREIGNIRCLALEKLAACIGVPCKYRSLGCRDVSPYQSRSGHEADCRFRPYNCPHADSGCLVTGDVPLLVAHLQSYHKVDTQEGPTFNHLYVIPNGVVSDATWKLTVLNCYDYQFCLHFEALGIGNSQMYMAFVRFMGHEEDAVKFRYSLEVIGSDRGKPKWEGRPRSIRDGHVKVRDSFEGLLVHPNMALLSKQGDDGHGLRLKIAGRISLDHKTEEETC